MKGESQVHFRNSYVLNNFDLLLLCRSESIANQNDGVEGGGEGGGGDGGGQNKASKWLLNVEGILVELDHYKKHPRYPHQEVGVSFSYADRPRLYILAVYVGKLTRRQVHVVVANMDTCEILRADANKFQNISAPPADDAGFETFIQVHVSTNYPLFPFNYSHFLNFRSLESGTLWLMRAEVRTPNCKTK